MSTRAEAVAETARVFRVPEPPYQCDGHIAGYTWTREGDESIPYVDVHDDQATGRQCPYSGQPF